MLNYWLCVHDCMCKTTDMSEWINKRTSERDKMEKQTMIKQRTVWTIGLMNESTNKQTNEKIIQQSVEGMN